MLNENALQDGMKLTGAFTVEMHDENGNLVDKREVKNVVVTAGKNYMATWLAAASQASPFMPYLALGTGVTGATAADTALQTELATRVAGTISSVGSVWQNTAVFGAGVDTGSITEAGIFSASSAGTMLARQTFGVITKAANNSITVTWQITIS